MIKKFSENDSRVLFKYKIKLYDYEITYLFHKIFTFRHIYLRFNCCLFLDGRRLPTNRRQRVFPNGTLQIEQVQRHEDEGNYVCSARATDSPSVEGSLKITVKGKHKNI